MFLDHTPERSHFGFGVFTWFFCDYNLKTCDTAISDHCPEVFDSVLVLYPNPIIHHVLLDVLILPLPGLLMMCVYLLKPLMLLQSFSLVSISMNWENIF